jgi:hypothetical protein
MNNDFEDVNARPNCYVIIGMIGYYIKLFYYQFF